MTGNKKMSDEQRAQIAELIRQGKKIKEIQQALGVPTYRITIVRKELSEQDAYRAKGTKMLVRKGFWDEWNAARGALLATKRKETAG